MRAFIISLANQAHPRTNLESIALWRYRCQIAVLDKGQLVDIGDHQSLINSCELYQRLDELQFKHLSA